MGEASADPQPAGSGEVALREDFAPWSFGEHASPAARSDQRAYHDELRARGYGVGTGCVVSRLAAVHPDTLQLGDRSTVAAHAHLTGDLRIGADCSVNVGTAVRGRVAIGDGVRIGSHTSLLGFDHGFDDVTVPIREQPLTSVGITVGDDVWIGSHVVVVDGVRIGDHAVLGAGTVVTRDVPPWAVVVGNPGRVVRDRREARGSRTPRTGESPVTGEGLRLFADRARAQAPDVLARSLDAGTGTWVDRPGRPATVRAHCDAVEIADLLLGGPPAPWSAEEHVARLRDLQSPDGLVPELGTGARAADASTPLAVLGDDTVAYHVLSVGYALDLLGSPWAAPIRPVASLDAAAVVAGLDAMDLARDAWGAGHRIDALGTAVMWELRAGRAPRPGVVEAMLGWLLVHRDPGTGLWGRPGPDGLRLAVNGFYRTVRGTFAQLGVELADGHTVIDTVLRHAADARVFGPGRASACDVLDVLHPLWWLTRRARDHRWPEIQAVARDHVQRIVARWAPDGGFAFASAARPGPDRAQDTGLQGTEMWLAALWYAADLLDLSADLGYTPRGVHRPGAAMDVGRYGAAAR